MRQFLPVAAGATTPYGVPSPSASVRSQISDGLPGLASGSRFVSLTVPFALVLRRNLQIFESSLDPGEGTGVQLHTPNPRVIRARPKKKKKNCRKRGAQHSPQRGSQLAVYVHRRSTIGSVPCDVVERFT